MTRSLLLSLLLCAPLAVRAEENWYRTERVQAYDADTIRCDVVFPWNVTLRGQSVRLAGVDAWEISRIRQTVRVSDAEIERGKRALIELNTLLAKGRLELQPLTYDGTDSVYGRIEANWRVVTADGAVDVAQWIRQNGHERK